ncbi:lytic transglycosylase domain-containing protein [Lichenicola sp.]|uniref:lytic transglycosylase domain-containing protein n=1 Tax=Lichenicola sp. TaxID=2804529 RepID=UPI003AFF6C59
MVRPRQPARKAHLSPVVLALVCVAAAPCRATTNPSGATPWAIQGSDLCQAATTAAERATGVPDQLLGAISRVETGRYDRQADAVHAWPWTINAEGIGHFYASKAEAVTAAHEFQNAGIRSIDVGCTQINLMFHPDGFSSLEQAFDPAANALYAARFLTDLFHQTGSWPHAAAAYHSQTPNLGSDYQRKVLDAWAEPLDRNGASAPPHHGVAEARTTQAAPSGPQSGDAEPPSARPLGGFGHIIRERPSVPAQTIFAAGNGGRGLSAYRARPVSLASLPPAGMRE